VFGHGASRTQLRDELDRLDLRRVLVVTSPGRRALAGELTRSFSESVVGTFADVAPHVPADVAEAARLDAEATGADGLLSLGGGSTIGVAKAVALHTGLPILAIPTTFSGSEMTSIYGTTTARHKQTGTAAVVAPRTVLYDPELTVSLPRDQAGPSALNAMAHAVEAYYAPGANPVTTLQAAEAIRVLAAGLPDMLHEPTDVDAKARVLYGAHLAACSLAVAGTGLHHKICHVLGGALNLPHAETHAIVLPQVIAFQQGVIPETIARVGDALHSDDPAGALHRLTQLTGAATSLAELGMRAEDLAPTTVAVMEAVVENAGHPLHASAIDEILSHALSGTSPERSDRESVVHSH
jgi:maleylacetate reductase